MGALLKRETACLQHNVECLFRNCRAKAHTCGPDLQGQSVGSLRMGSVCSLHTVNSEIPVLPGTGGFACLSYMAQKQVSDQVGGERSDLTPPQTSGAGAEWLEPVWYRKSDSEGQQICVWQGQVRLRRQLVDSKMPATHWSVAGGMHVDLHCCIQFCLLNLPICFPSFHASVKAASGRDYLLLQAP